MNVYIQMKQVCLLMYFQLDVGDFLIFLYKKKKKLKKLHTFMCAVYLLQHLFLKVVSTP